MARRANDLYTTNSKLVDVLFGRIPIVGSVVEPCAGPGRMADAIRAHNNHVITNDIEYGYPTDYVGDASDTYAGVWNNDDHIDGYEWAITNPPFSMAEGILPVCWCNVRQGMAILLRLSYMEPTKTRHRWLSEMADHQIAQIVVNPRPKFRAGEINPKTGKEFGNDNVTVAWFVWSKTWSWNRLGIPSPFKFGHKWRKS